MGDPVHSPALPDLVRSAAIDPQAFTRLVELEHERLLGWARRVLRDHHLAEEAVQAAWLAVPRNGAAFTPRGHDEARDVRAWLQCIVLNAARRHIARERAREGVLRRWLRVRPAPRPMPTPLDLLEDADQHALVWAAARDLPESLRRTLELRFRDGHPPAVVAARMRCSELTVRVRTSRALSRLRRYLRLMGILVSSTALLNAMDQRACSRHCDRPPTATIIWTRMGLGVTGLVTAMVLLAIWVGRAEPVAAPRPHTLPEIPPGTDGMWISTTETILPEFDSRNDVGPGADSAHGTHATSDVAAKAENPIVVVRLDIHLMSSPLTSTAMVLPSFTLPTDAASLSLVMSDGAWARSSATHQIAYILGYNRQRGAAPGIFTPDPEVRVQTFGTVAFATARVERDGVRLLDLEVMQAVPGRQEQDDDAWTAGTYERQTLCPRFDVTSGHCYGDFVYPWEEVELTFSRTIPLSEEGLFIPTGAAALIPAISGEVRRGTPQGVDHEPAGHFTAWSALVVPRHEERRESEGDPVAPSGPG